MVLGIGAIILFSAVVGAHSQTWFISTGFYRHRTIVYGLWAAGAFTIGLGVLPVVCLAALVRPRGEQWTRELKAYVSLTCARPARIRPLHGDEGVLSLDQVLNGRRRAEPDLPRAAAVRRDRRSRSSAALALWAVLGTAGFCLYVILTTPYQLDLWPYSDALGFSIVQMANRDLAMDDRDVTWLLVVVLIVSVAMLVVPRLFARPRMTMGSPPAPPRS